MQVEFKFLADKVFLAKHDWNVSIPEQEEVLSFALVERLSHLLDAIRLILDKVIL